MSLAFARRLLLREVGGPAEALLHWKANHPDSPVAAARLDGGWMVYPGPGLPWGGAVGLGLSGAVADDLLDRLDAFFAPLRHDPRVLVCPYADPALLGQLQAHGFRARSFRHVMVRDGAPLPPGPTTPGVEVTRGGEPPGLIARGFNEGAEPTGGPATGGARRDDARADRRGARGRLRQAGHRERARRGDRAQRAPLRLPRGLHPGGVRARLIRQS